MHAKYPSTPVFCKRNTGSFYWKMEAKQMIEKSTGSLASPLQSAMLHALIFM